MADEKNAQLTDEEKIAQKVKFRRTISYVLMVVAAISLIAVFILLLGTKERKDTQMVFDTSALRSKIKQLIALEHQYYDEHGEYAKIDYFEMSDEIPRYNPNIDGMYKYKFDPKTGIATGIEKDDANQDGDVNDGLTLSVEWEPDITKGSDYFWPDDDLEYFRQKRQEAGITDSK